MARYSALLGRRVEVVYRAGEIRVSASGTLAADSGKSIFIEQQHARGNSTSTFRWEIPYQCIQRVYESRPPTEAEPSTKASSDRTAPAPSLVVAASEKSA
jgi:hypothetical protein